MSQHRIYLVDAFTDQAFAGNPAGVMPLSPNQGFDSVTMQQIALEMNQAETAFVVPLETASSFGLRWFTPAVEVDLCGHATLAAAHILWQTGAVSESENIRFETRSGTLTASKRDGRIVLDFPAEPPVESTLDSPLSFLPETIFVGKNRMDWFVVLGDGADLRSIRPNMTEIADLGMRGLIVTSKCAPGDEFDFQSRFFAPQSGVPEDPVTGSAHCCLGPYWSGKLGLETVRGFQASPRGGSVVVQVRHDRVLLIGSAITTLEGFITCL